MLVYQYKPKTFGPSLWNPALLAIPTAALWQWKLRRVPHGERALSNISWFLLIKSFSRWALIGYHTKNLPVFLAAREPEPGFQLSQGQFGAHRLPRGIQTCWWPSLDIASAVDNSILCFTFFHRAQAIPEWRRNTKTSHWPTCRIALCFQTMTTNDFPGFVKLCWNHSSVSLGFCTLPAPLCCHSSCTCFL